MITTSTIGRADQIRFVIYGAGAVGGTIGALLHLAGHDVTFICRGEHLRAIQESGLRLQRPDGERILAISAIDSPDAIQSYAGSVVLLAVKGQDTRLALAALADVAPGSLPIVCAQNGVDNERQALRLFENVYGICVMLPASHLEPGIIRSFGTPHAGVLHIGRYPSGADQSSESIASALTAAGFVSTALAEIMRLKYHKLVRNVVNALEALVGTEVLLDDIADRATEEARNVLARAGIDFASDEEFAASRKGFVRTTELGGEKRSGRSSWQSLIRRTGRIEADYLNGEIAMLGRLYRVPTPVNEVLQREANRAARLGLAPGTFSMDVIRAMVDEATGTREEPPTIFG